MLQNMNFHRNVFKIRYMLGTLDNCRPNLDVMMHIICNLMKCVVDFESGLRLN